MVQALHSIYSGGRVYEFKASLVSKVKFSHIMLTLLLGSLSQDPSTGTLSKPVLFSIHDLVGLFIKKFIRIV